MRISAMRNLGPRSERLLSMVGIPDSETLAEVGPAEAYQRLQDASVPGLSRIMLWAMEGALTDTDWRDLSEQRKRELLADLAVG